MHTCSIHSNYGSAAVTQPVRFSDFHWHSMSLTKFSSPLMQSNSNRLFISLSLSPFHLPPLLLIAHPCFLFSYQRKKRKSVVCPLRLFSLFQRRCRRSSTCWLNVSSLVKPARYLYAQMAISKTMKMEIRDELAGRRNTQAVDGFLIIVHVHLSSR